MVEVPWPITNNPGLKPQEGSGRLVNVFAEKQSDGRPVWRRAPGASVFARTPSSGTIGIEFNVNAIGQTMLDTFEFVGSLSTGLPADGATYTVSYPQNTAANDLVVMIQGSEIRTGPWGTPTGFTVLAQTTSTITDTQVAYKVSTGEISTDVLAGTTAGVSSSLLMFSIRGADTTSPIDASAAAVTTASGPADPPATTTLTTGALMVAVGWVNNTNNVSITAPASYGIPLAAGTTQTSSATACTCMAAFYVSTAATANDPTTFTNAGSTTQTAGYSFAIKRSG